MGAPVREVGLSAETHGPLSMEPPAPELEHGERWCGGHVDAAAFGKPTPVRARRAKGSQ